MTVGSCFFLPIFVQNASWLISIKSVFSCETEIKMNQRWNVKRMKWINCHKHTHGAGKSENKRTRCASVWKIVCGCRFDVAEVCTRACMCVHMKKISWTQTKCRRIAARVYACQRNTPTQLTCGSPAVLPLLYPHSLYLYRLRSQTNSHAHTQTKQSPDEQNEYMSSEHTDRIVCSLIAHVLSRNQMNHFLCWHPCRLWMKRRTIWKSDRIMLVSMWFISKIIPTGKSYHNRVCLDLPTIIYTIQLRALKWKWYHHGLQYVQFSAKPTKNHFGFSLLHLVHIKFMNGLAKFP